MGYSSVRHLGYSKIKLRLLPFAFLRFFFLFPSPAYLFALSSLWVCFLEIFTFLLSHSTDRTVSVSVPSWYQHRRTFLISRVYISLVQVVSLVLGGLILIAVRYASGCIPHLCLSLCFWASSGCRYLNVCTSTLFTFQSQLQYQSQSSVRQIEAVVLSLYSPSIVLRAVLTFSSSSKLFMSRCTNAKEMRALQASCAPIYAPPSFPPF